LAEREALAVAAVSAPFLSERWYRVAQLRPRLHQQVTISRQRFRGQPWYILHDRSSGQVHRFTPATYALIHAMDGTRSLNELWNALAEQLGDRAPSQDEVIELMQRLHAADVLQAGVLPDVAEVADRMLRRTRSTWMRNLSNPIALRFPVWDPDHFLKRTAPAMRWLMGRAAVVVWSLVVAVAGFEAAHHWGELSGNLADRVLGLQNLALLWLTYPIVKLCHELGHAYAVKRGGGEVHELGVMLLVFAPVPYVDASASTAFRSKWQRMGVAAAGILVEVFVAAVAMFVWLMVEPGVVRSMAYNVMLIGGASTLLFNGNPLLRCDGYYVLSDWLEIPNLGARSNEYLAYLFRRRLCGDSEATSPAHGPGEAVWLTLYAPVSWLYRLIVMAAISVFIAGKYFFLGTLLALWSLATVFVWPALTGLHHVLSGAAYGRRRRRAVWVTVGGGATIALILAFVAVPYWTSAEGVVWVPDNAEVRAGTPGFVTRLLAVPGRWVREGEPLLQLQDDDVATELAAHQAKVDRLEVQLSAEMFTDRLQAELTREGLDAERAAVARLQRRVDELVALAGRDGIWVVPNAVDLDGRFVPQGGLVGYVLAGTLRTVRVVIPQADADLVRSHTRRIELRLADRPWQTLRATAVREVPGGSERLPSKALTLEGGGLYATDPRDSSGLKTLERTFQFDLELEPQLRDLTFGTRVYVRFEHAWLPLGVQTFRRVRQLFLSRLTL
jgi:putative peptide zinc metalloprotease protein